MDEKLKFKRKKKIFLIIISLSVLILVSLFILRKSIKNIFNQKITTKISQKLGRDLSYLHISYSLNKIEIDDIAVHEKNSDKIFAKAQKLSIKFNLKEILTKKKDFEIEKISIEGGEINLIKRDEWNFSDILDLFSDNKRKISENYFVRNLEIKNSDILIKKEGVEYLLKNINSNIKHQKDSEIFDITLKSDSYVNLASNNIFFKSDISLILDISDRANKLDISKFELSEIIWNNLKAEKIISKFFINSDSGESNFEIKITYLSGIKELDFIKKINEIYKKIYSRNINIKETIEINIKTVISKNKIFLNINSDDFSISSNINIIDNIHILNFRTANFFIETNSIIREPSIKSNLSEQINDIVKRLVIEYEEFIIKLATKNKN